MVASRLRIGVAGVGHFGRYHALKVAASKRATLVGVHDPDTERAKAIGWEVGAAEPASGSTVMAKVFASIPAGNGGLTTAALP